MISQYNLFNWALKSENLKLIQYVIDHRLDFSDYRLVNVLLVIKYFPSNDQLWNHFKDVKMLDLLHKAIKQNHLEAITVLINDPKCYIETTEHLVYQTLNKYIRNEKYMHRIWKLWFAYFGDTDDLLLMIKQK